MSWTRSLSLMVPASARADADALMAALGRGPDTFSVPMAPGRTGSPTAWGAHTYDDALLAILEAGTLPAGIDWAAHGLTQRRAQDALAAIRFRAVVGRGSVANFEALETREGVGRIAPADDAPGRER